MERSSQPEHGAVFVGIATMDAIALLPRFPAPDERVVADAIVRAGGGPAATAAVTFARLGLTARFVGALGDDEDAASILADLAAEGVNADHALRASGARSGASVVLVDGPRGTRAICNRPPPRLTVSPDSSTAALVRAARFVHADQAGWPALAPLLASPEGGNPRVSLDAGNPVPDFDPDRDLAGLDVFAPTLERLAQITDLGDPDAALAAAVARGARWVVATRGAEGAVAAAADGMRCSVPAYPAEIRSTLGAGDVFHGALLAARVREMPLPEAVAYAAICAALSCRGLDGRSAIPTHDEVMARLSAFMPSVTLRIA